MTIQSSNDVRQKFLTTTLPSLFAYKGLRSKMTQKIKVVLYRGIELIQRKGYLKIVPKRRVDLTEEFDKVDLGVETIGKWKEFEKRFYEAGA